MPKKPKLSLSKLDIIKRIDIRSVTEHNITVELSDINTVLDKNTRMTVEIYHGVRSIEAAVYIRTRKEKLCEKK